MSEPVRVSFCLSNGGIGGTELNAIRTAERLDRDRYDLEIICLADYAPLRERYEALGIPVHRLRIRSLKSADTLTEGWKLASRLRRRRVQIFHAHDSYGNIVGVPWARLAGVRGVIASRRWWQDEPRPGHTAGNRVAFRMAHTVLTNTPAGAGRLRDEGVADEKIRVVPNFLDDEMFQPPQNDVLADLRTELRIPSDAKVVGIVAQLRPEKDHLTLVRAAARVAERDSAVHFVFVGEGELRGEIEALRSTLRLEDRVHLAGLRHGQGNLHHMFDVSVLCSTTEALSNSILEAMAAGRPVVATRVGGNPDAVIDGETGLLVPVGDVEALADALHSLLRDPERTARLGEAGRTRARSEYTFAAAQAALEATYESLLRAPQRLAHPDALVVT